MAGHAHPAPLVTEEPMAFSRAPLPPQWGARAICLHPLERAGPWGLLLGPGAKPPSPPGKLSCPHACGGIHKARSGPARPGLVCAALAGLAFWGPGVEGRLGREGDSFPSWFFLLTGAVRQLCSRWLSTLASTNHPPKRCPFLCAGLTRRALCHTPPHGALGSGVVRSLAQGQLVRGRQAVWA